MKKLFLATALVTSVLSGCATVPMESELKTNTMKEFKAPSSENAGIYVYRKNSHFGAALKKDVWIDGKCVGETAKGVFFYQEVEGDKEHTISTESEFSPNDITIKTKGGQLYFVEQFIKLGAFVGGAGIKKTESSKGKADIAKLDMGKKGRCSGVRS